MDFFLDSSRDDYYAARQTAVILVSRK